MPYTKITFVDRIAEHPARRKLSTIDTAQVFGVYDVERDEGTVSQEGTPLNATTFNTLQDNVAAALGKELTGTLTAGSTTLAFTDAAISSNSIVDIYVSVYGISPTAASIADNTLTLTFETQASDLGVMVVIK